MVSSDDDQQLLSASCVDHSSNGNNGLGDIDPFCHRIEMPTWMW
jgi:hypothetical protein